MSLRGWQPPSVKGMLVAGSEECENDQMDANIDYFTEPVTLTVWGHDPYSVHDDVLVDMKLLPESTVEGNIAELSTMVDGERRNLYFTVRPTTEASKNAQLSINSQLLNSLGILPRSSVQVKVRPRSVAQIDVVELHFKGMYLTRADQYRIAKTLSRTCVYKGQRISLLGSLVRLNVSSIFRNGKHKFSGYVGPHTRLVFRSDSARMLVFIQMSTEMWQFDETGDVMFHQLVNSFIPEMLRRWRNRGDHHVVSIILFTTVSTSSRRSRLPAGELENNAHDYYRVVIDRAHISRWTDIMATLRYEFGRFSKDILVNKQDELKGMFLPSSKCNILQALSLATSLLSPKFTDRDLCRANVQAMVITPGSGVFDVERSSLFSVSEMLLKAEIGMELVCLARPPLHITPLFRTKDAHGQLEHYVPTWMNVSFWNTPGRYRKQWIPRCKIYDLQMMGIMENEIKAISIRHLAHGPHTTRFMKNYDTNVFKSEDMIDNQRQIEEAARSSSSAVLLRPSECITAPGRAVSLSTTAVAVGNTISNATAEANTPAVRDKLGELLKGARKVTPLARTVQLLNSAASIRSPSLRPQRSISSIPSVATPETDILSLPLNASSSRMPTPSPAVSAQQALRRTSPRSPSPSPARTERRLSIHGGQLKPPPMPIPSSRPLRIQRPVNMRLSPSITFTPPPAALKVRRGSSLSINKGLAGIVGSPDRPSIRASISGPSTSSAVSPHTKPSLDEFNWDMFRLLHNPSTIDQPTRLRAYGRWANVFPPGTDRKAVSWHSIKSPASLPITTEVFPSPSVFQSHYKFQFYDLAAGLEHESFTAGQLLDEMICLRLQMGFQIVVGRPVVKVEQSLPRGNPDLVCQSVQAKNYVGARIYLARKSLIHRLAIEQDGAINVQVYTFVNPEQKIIEQAPKALYPLSVKTKYDADYHAIDNVFVNSNIVTELNWSQLDQQLAGIDDSVSDGSPYFIATRFALISADKRVEGPHLTKLTSEEIAVEGIRKVVQALLKNRYYGDEKPQPDDNVPVHFYTGDLNRSIEQMYEESFKSVERSELFRRDRFNKDVDLKDLASEIQSDHGIVFKDRRWHWKAYSHAFCGQDLVVWMCHAFTDIKNADEAVEYGNQLMEKGFMHHVDNRHKFMDGHFFYQLSDEYELEGESSSKRWFGSANSSTAGAASGNEKGKRPHVVLSRAVQIDVDPKKLSNRKELITVHIDRTHNPKNAFVMRFEWLNATPRLIDDLVTGLGRLASGYGIKLVQVPVEEVSRDSFHSPFRSSLQLRFCLDPKSVPLPQNLVFDPLDEDPHFYQHYVLRRLGFIMDMPSKELLDSTGFQIRYSWGTPAYRNSQYVHGSGCVMAQVMEDGTFYMLANSIYMSRLSTFSNPSDIDKSEEMILESFAKLCDNDHGLHQLFTEAQGKYNMQKGSPSTWATPTSQTPLEAEPFA